MAFTNHHHQLHYTSLHQSINSICKTMLPFPFKKRKGLPRSDSELANLQSDNIKWQQESFHQILKLMGLQKEGILSATQVASFRSHLIDTLIASSSLSSPDYTPILRDKLLFLKELFLANCISEHEYHSSKRPLLQRLAVLGAEIDASDVIVGSRQKETGAEEEWSEIDLTDETVVLKEVSSNKLKHRSALKQIKGAASSVLGMMPQKSALRKQWGLKKWKDSSGEGQRVASSGNSDDEAFDGSCKLVSAPIGEGPDTKQMKKKLHPDGSSSDFFIDKVLGDRIRMKLSQIQSEINTISSSIQFRNDDIEAISTKLPVDMADLNKLFSKTWCEKYGNVVLDVVRKEFKEHVGKLSSAKRGGRQKTVLENDENCHPEHLSRDRSLSSKMAGSNVL